MKSILDRSFEYTSAAATDVGRRFRRIWREHRLERGRVQDIDEAHEQAIAELRAETEQRREKVRPLAPPARAR